MGKMYIKAIWLVFHSFNYYWKVVLVSIKVPYHYNIVCNQVDKIINIKELNINIKDLYQKLLELHNSKISFLLFDSICGNENYSVSFNINNDDIINTKKKYRSVLLNNYNKPVLNEYICIHIRCGDIKNDKSRYLDIYYFIDKYNELIKTINKILPVYIVTQINKKQDIDILNEKIPNCTIIQSDDVTSFYYLVHCTYLIASRSGFSNLAYILGNMKVLKPPNDWNCYWDNTL